MTTDTTNDRNNAPRDYDNSRVLDVHIWSNYPEVNDFISKIYEAYFSKQNGKKSIAKKHIKVVLLDLYVAWLDDPDLCLAIHMTRDHYSKNFGTNTSRYNELNISAKTIGVVKTLKENGLIGFKEGFERQEGFSSGRISRIWAEPPLVRLFEKSALNEFMIYSHNDRETIVLKDSDKNKIDYPETEETESQRYVVQYYNELLERTFIDIGSANSPRLEIVKNKGSKNPNMPHYVNIQHRGKFTHRVFNNSSFTESGRFYGGFWQRIGEDYRTQILINDEETVELDFSSLHPVLAYANAGVDYWKEYPNVGPYDILVDGIDDSKVAREIVKKLLLLALNASDQASLFKAFRSEFDYSLLEETFSFPDAVLSKILDSIKAKHPVIADQIATGAGTMLMNLDGKIVEFVIKRFLAINTPVLSVHDSFIVQISKVNELKISMEDAWVFVTGQEVTKYKQNLPLHQDAAAWKNVDFGFYLDAVAALPKAQSRTTGYLNRLNKHNKFFNLKMIKKV
ncbi:hypothetical protein N9K33_04690 [Planktomarina temperata]|nr:hypothetical protein [Planktomarina temperata]